MFILLVRIEEAVAALDRQWLPWTGSGCLGQAVAALDRQP